VEIAVAQDLQGGMKQVEARLREGLSLESILLDWIAAAARLLGDQWLADERSFAEVTLGLGSLHRLLAMLRHRFKPPLRHRGLVVLVTAPGEQHTLAIHVLGDLLQHAGWEAVVRPNLAEDELVAMVSCEPVVMVGISISSEDFLRPVDRIVARVRESSLNRAVAVMLGGAIDLSSFSADLGAVFCPTARVALAWLDRHARISFEPGPQLVDQRSS
jgi:methanogenic corrinoid protein MtbC1